MYHEVPRKKTHVTRWEKRGQKLWELGNFFQFCQSKEMLCPLKKHASHPWQPTHKFSQNIVYNTLIGTLLFIWGLVLRKESLTTPYPPLISSIPLVILGCKKGRGDGSPSLTEGGVPMLSTIGEFFKERTEESLWFGCLSFTLSFFLIYESFPLGTRCTNCAGGWAGGRADGRIFFRP